MQRGLFEAMRDLGLVFAALFNGAAVLLRKVHSRFDSARFSRRGKSASIFPIFLCLSFNCRLSI
jgi:hypothetical protein